MFFKAAHASGKLTLALGDAIDAPELENSCNLNKNLENLNSVYIKTSRRLPGAHM